MPDELEQAAADYDEQDGTYRSMIRQGASPRVLLVAATAAWEAADHWQAVAYRAYFDHPEYPGARRGPGGTGRDFRSLDIETEVAEALTDVWRDIAEAHRVFVDESSSGRHSVR